MNILFPVVVALICFLVALRVYPRRIASAFRENDDTPPPSVEFADGQDYVKSKTAVVFGHHFATIAGAGPIIGPTLAIAFGWQPVWLWVVLGGIFYGAVHDMCAMFASVREGGKSIAEIARRTLGSVGYLLMLITLVFVLTIINAIFLKLSVTALTSVYPLEQLGPEASRLLKTKEIDGVVHGRVGGIATTSVIIITLFAPVLGLLIRRQRIRVSQAFALAFAVALVSIIAGFHFPIMLDGTVRLGDEGVVIDHWAIVMTIYVLIATAIPVWVVLQPRDFTNVQILYGGLFLLLISAIVAGIGGRSLASPAWDIATGQTLRGGALWPVLFITVACGAISGFHSLVASGTSSKQIPRESDCRRIGYGAMVLESFFAVLVIVAVASLPRAEYVQIVYDQSNWVLGFALGAGRLTEAALPFVPLAVATVFGILMIEGFIITTLDTSVRLCRYMLEEFWNFVFQGQAPRLLRSPLFNALVAVGLMVAFYLNATLGKMWNVFGAGNQLMGALALTTVSVWLVQRARRHLFAMIPAVFMLATTIAALHSQMKTNFAAEGNHVLGGAALGLMILSLGVVAIGVTRFAQAIQANARRPAVAGAGGS
jgi:carbon starvation protein